MRRGETTRAAGSADRQANPDDGRNGERTNAAGRRMCGPAETATQVRTELARLKHPVHLLALGFGVGLIPRAPGTFATLLAAIAGWWLLPLPLAVRAGLVAAMAIAGIRICAESARRLETHDHPAIVWDEIVGFLAVSLVLPPAPLWWLIAFVLFRLFDILKPWPIRQLDVKVGGGLGIMLDDLAAAGATAVCVGLARMAGL